MRAHHTTTGIPSWLMPNRTPRGYLIAAILAYSIGAVVLGLTH